MMFRARKSQIGTLGDAYVWPHELYELHKGALVV